MNVAKMEVFCAKKLFNSIICIKFFEMLQRLVSILKAQTKEICISVISWDSALYLQKL